MFVNECCFTGASKIIHRPLRVKKVLKNSFQISLFMHGGKKRRFKVAKLSGVSEDFSATLHTNEVLCVWDGKLMKDSTTNEIIKFPLTIKCNQSSVKRCQNPCLKGRRWDEGAFHLGTRRVPPGDTTHALERQKSRGVSHPPRKRWQPSEVCHCLLAMPGESGWYLLWLGHNGVNLTTLTHRRHPWW